MKISTHERRLYNTTIKDSQSINVECFVNIGAHINLSLLPGEKLFQISFNSIWNSAAFWNATTTHSLVYTSLASYGKGEDP